MENFAVNKKGRESLAMRKKSITIGIPAYNEENNIRSLLTCLLEQRQVSYRIKNIIVYSDASTDDTLSNVRSIKNNKIVLINGLQRNGVAAAQNIIIQKVKSDILVLLNADIFIKDSLFIEKLIKPVIMKKADLTSSALYEIPPLKFFERIIVESMNWKRSIFEAHRNGKNLFTCHGPARAFSKKMYTKLFFPMSVAEDAYTYLLGLSNHFPYIYVRSAKAFYKAPDTLRDHEKQSVRFMKSKKYLVYYFEKDFIEEQYKLPKKLIVSTFLHHFLRKPITMSLYISILIYMRLKSDLSSQSETWDVATTSKTLIT